MRFVPAVLLCTLAACSAMEQDIQDQSPMFSPRGGDIRNPGPTVHSSGGVDPANPIANGGSNGPFATSPSGSNSNPGSTNPWHMSPSGSSNPQTNSAMDAFARASRPSGSPSPTGDSPISSGSAGHTPRSGEPASALKLKQTGEMETAEIVVARRGAGGRFELVTFLQSDTWHFQRRVNNRDGTDSWFFIRRKMNDRGIEDILFNRRKIDRGQPGPPQTQSPR